VGGGGVGDPLVWVVASPVEGKKIGDMHGGPSGQHACFG
jgi:hypothetical protein